MRLGAGRTRLVLEHHPVIEQEMPALVSVSVRLLVTVLGTLARALLTLVIVSTDVVNHIVIERPLLVVVVEHNELVVVPRALDMRAPTLTVRPACKTVPIRS